MKRSAMALVMLLGGCETLLPAPVVPTGGLREPPSEECSRINRRYQITAVLSAAGGLVAIGSGVGAAVTTNVDSSNTTVPSALGAVSIGTGIIAAVSGIILTKTARSYVDHCTDNRGR